MFWASLLGDHAAKADSVPLGIINLDNGEMSTKLSNSRFLTENVGICGNRSYVNRSQNFCIFSEDVRNRGCAIPTRLCLLWSEYSSGSIGRNLVRETVARVPTENMDVKITGRRVAAVSPFWERLNNSIPHLVVESSEK
jgi:hypothetical protein